ncbi:MAG TPA: hypothetical protein VFN23_19895 [Ktedonobacteraceae bacterium]|nr:hypothetical protein [Ktedonobacteraceae bacterium]
MTTTLTPAIHLAAVYNLLTETYGEPQNNPDYDPLGGLIGTILSQHTSDINSGRAYKQLVDAYPTWEEVRDAPTYKVAEAIRSGGLANIKAPRIQDVLMTLTEQQAEQGGNKSLAEYLYDELIKRSPDESWKYLRTIHGVGPKTAACVLMFNMNLAVMPLDTHVFRSSQRLGLIGPKTSVDKAHTLFAKVVPSEWVYILHVDLIRHGREICHSQRPECGRCPLHPECAYVGSVDPSETAFSEK